MLNYCKSDKMMSGWYAMPSFDAGLGSLQLEYDANKSPAIFQQLCELKLNEVITQASSVDIDIITATACCA